MKFNSFFNPNEDSYQIVANIGQRELNKLMVEDILFRFTEKVARYMAREYMRSTKGKALKKALDQRYLANKILDLVKKEIDSIKELEQ